MTLIEALSKMKLLQVPVFKTADAAACLRVSRPHASKTLARLSQAGLLKAVAHGLWSWPEVMDPLILPEYLTTPAPAYISLYSALFYHGIIEQIPDTTYAVSLARTKRYQTKLGLISIHHLHEHFFFGFETIGEYGFKMATPEKALLDTLYFYKTRSGWFRSLPEIHLTEAFEQKKVFEMLSRIPEPLKAAVQKKLQNLL